ncbi:MAG: OmpA family protein [Caldimonas sp.]
MPSVHTTLLCQVIASRELWRSQTRGCHDGWRRQRSLLLVALSVTLARYRGTERHRTVLYCAALQRGTCCCAHKVTASGRDTRGPLGSGATAKFGIAIIAALFCMGAARPRGLRRLPPAAPSRQSVVTRGVHMKHARTLRHSFTLLTFAGALTAASAWAQSSSSSVDVGTHIPEASAVKDGLFPEDACKELEASGFKCMGFKPAIRYSLPATSFKVGSAELPELLKKQLDVFADVLRGKRGSARTVRVIGHADSSGTPEVNEALSLKRAEAVKSYLVQKGADEKMLLIVGEGAKDPINPANPKGAENRRVEIGRTLK